MLATRAREPVPAAPNVAVGRQIDRAALGEPGAPYLTPLSPTGSSVLRAAAGFEHPQDRRHKHGVQQPGKQSGDPKHEQTREQIERKDAEKFEPTRRSPCRPRAADDPEQRENGERPAPPKEAI